MLSCFSHVQLFATLWTAARPDSSVHWILQVRMLEQVANPFSRESSRPRDPTCVSSMQVDSLLLSHWGRPSLVASSGYDHSSGQWDVGGTSRKSLPSWIKRVVLPLIPAWSWDMRPGSSFSSHVVSMTQSAWGWNSAYYGWQGRESEMSGSLVALLSDRISPELPISSAPLSMGILQARILEWVAMSPSRGIFPTQGLNPGLPHCIFFFSVWVTREAQTSY